MSTTDAPTSTVTNPAVARAPAKCLDITQGVYCVCRALLPHMSAVLAITAVTGDERQAREYRAYFVVPAGNRYAVTTMKFLTLDREI